MSGEWVTTPETTSTLFDSSSQTDGDYVWEIVAAVMFLAFVLAALLQTRFCKVCRFRLTAPQNVTLGAI